MTRENIINILRNSEATVTFLKKDGSKRVMKCTLRPDVLPALKGSNHKKNEDVLPVWDLEKNAWRSFRLDSIIKIGD
jgi:hypothetical protein